MARREKQAGELERTATAAERDAYWLGHLRAIEDEGIGKKSYAEREGLRVQSLYEARKRLVQRNVWPRTRRVGTKPKFARVQIAAPTRGGCRLRIGSAELEWAEPPGVEVLSALLERVVARR